MRENKAFAEITGAKVNRGADYSLEVVSTVSMDLTLMLTKGRRSLSIYLLINIISCVIENFAQ